jgi:hypothetical protein
MTTNKPAPAAPKEAPKPETKAAKAEPAPDAPEILSAPMRVKNLQGEDITEAEAETAQKPAAHLVLPVIVGKEGKPSVTLSQPYPVLGAVRSVTVGSRDFQFAGVKRNDELKRTENRLRPFRVADKAELDALIRDGGWTKE